MRRRSFLGGVLGGIPVLGAAINTPGAHSQPSDPTYVGSEDRTFWVEIQSRIATPVFSNLASGTLRKNMPVEYSPSYDGRENVTYLEAVGRSLAGIAPWMALPIDSSDEGVVRERLRQQVLQGLSNGVEPENSDYLNFRTHTQPLVDAAYLAHGFLRAPQALWAPLSNRTKQQFITEFSRLRDRKPWNNNWLLFAAIREVFLLSIGEDWDKLAVELAIESFANWYRGDGWYSDGDKFSFDYYNAYVIHPMLVDTLAVLADNKLVSDDEYQTALKRMQRYSAQQERMISPEGTFPPIGRSITYRSGAFQALAQTALMDQLPQGLSRGQVRAALTAVYRRLLVPASFDDDNWLRLGFCGHQPEVADYYTATGSLYMATLGFLPLGLPQDHAFWTEPAQPWTAQKAWSGANFPSDYHIKY